MEPSLVNRFAPLIVRGIHETPPWRSLVCELRRRFSCTLASLVLRHSSEPVWNGCATSDAEWDIADWTRKNIPRFIRENPFRVEQLAPGRCYSGEEMLPREQLIQSSFYREVLVPAGIEVFVCICVAEPAGYKGWLYLSRPESTGFFTAKEQAECSSLIPLLEEALQCFATLMRRTFERDVYEDTLARMGVGTAILDTQLKVLNVDHIAEDIMRRSPVLQVVDSRIKIRSKPLAADFLRLCEQVMRNDTSSHARAIRIPRHGHEDLRLLLRTMHPTRDYGNESRPSLMVFISDPESNRRSLPTQLLSDLFGLTAAEAIVAGLLAQGLSIHDVAERLALSAATVRSHLKRIFSKVEVNRQAELVRVLTGSLSLFH